MKKRYRLKVLFQAFSNLVSINVDFVNSLIVKGADMHVIPELYLAKFTLAREKVLHGYKAKLVPIDLIFKFFSSNTMLRNYLAKFDVIHITGFTSFIRKLVKGSCKPTILTLGIPLPKEYEDLLDYVDVIVAPSRFTSQCSKENVPQISNLQNKILIIPWGVNTTLFNPLISRDYSRECLNIPKDKKVILWNSRISPEKDLETLIEAAELVARNVLFYIKGRGLNKQYWRRLRNRVKKLEKEGVLRPHIGWIDYRKLPFLYRASDIFVHTSTFEAFGLVFLEAMACGIPIIAANAATASEILGEAALLFKPRDPYDLADKILSLLNDYELQYKLSLRGIKRVKNFDWKIIAEKYCSIYSSLVKR